MPILDIGKNVWLLKPICLVVGIAYPAIASFKAVATVSKADDVQWLIYWICYGLFYLVESILDVIFGSILGGTYYLCKIGFFCWMQLPVSGGKTGAQIICQYLLPLYRRYEGEIDDLFEQGEQMIQKGTKMATNYAFKKMTGLGK
ncbi:TB2/DP1/HVA22-related protein like protein [Aduncisulcus paluster]|uniref:TB2/DP1/HVA22-related protein like protein n=1 Tax=Aduncisulcus paluster TaxID=2918883 RepID=A0ABQ5KKL1_9EUKA|nr:TB2/DP1/HVA22-related protein like protein [Aduncisulcus paluster]